MGERPRGTVTPISNVFPPAEARKAAQRVEEALEVPRQELDKLQEFSNENRELMKLIQKLPDEVSHKIMVPFGPAAFFSGKMIHTNEFLVLLGERLYAQRSAKQTLDILNRRAKFIDSKVEDVKALIENLHAEASFFNSTARDAAEGVMEIREEYIETSSLPKEVKPEVKIDTVRAAAERSNCAVEDKAFDRIMSRLAELEKEEAEAEAEAESKEESISDDSDLADSRGECMGNSDDDGEMEIQKNIYIESNRGKARDISVVKEHLRDKPDDTRIERDAFITRNTIDILNFGESKGKSVKKVTFAGDPYEGSIESLRSKPLKVEMSSSKKLSINERSVGSDSSSARVFTNDPSIHEKSKIADTRKAFTGLIVEHGPSETSGTEASDNVVMDKKAPKPLSRFKMQKAGHQL